jgi:kelch-like protein 18
MFQRMFQANATVSFRCRLGVAVLGGLLYACGGYDGSTFLRSVEVYDPRAGKWSFVTPMAITRSRVALAANADKLWAVGGYDGVANLRYCVFQPSDVDICIKI